MSSACRTASPAATRREFHALDPVVVAGNPFRRNDSRRSRRVRPAGM